MSCQDRSALRVSLLSVLFWAVLCPLLQLAGVFLVVFVICESVNRLVLCVFEVYESVNSGCVCVWVCVVCESVNRCFLLCL